MHLRLRILLALALISFSAAAQKYLDMIDAGTYPVSAIQQEAKAYFDGAGRGRGTGYKQFKRWEYVALLELDNNGVKRPNAELSRQARDYRKAERQRQLAESSDFAGDWKPLGPTYWNATSGWNPGVGRVTSIGVDLGNNNHLIVGSPTGGVWKTLNGGNTWTPLTDEFSTTDVFALEISPYNNNHYLWGSSSGRIYRSTDAGATWAATGNVTGSGRVSRIQYHPTDPNIVYAVSESNGLFRSTNSGSTWTAVSGVSGIVGYDVEFKPGDPNTIYFSGTSVYRSTNGGTSFSQIGSFGTAGNNYKMMGVSPANPNVVYVLESNGGRFGAFYKSTNSGSSYTKLVDGADINYFGYSETGDDGSGQAPRDMDVVANPADADEVHIAGVHTWKSVDGGVSFFLTSYWEIEGAMSLGVGYNHADIALLKYIGNILYVGSDGGIHISTDGAATFIDRTSGLGIREFYKIGVSKTNPNVVSGGSQDNGTSVMRGANRSWQDWLGADGMETFVNWNNASILYGTSQYGSMYRSTNQGNSYNSISKPGGVDDGNWVTPFEQDPQISTTIYVAFADVWKSTNSGGTWTKISSFDNGNLDQMKLAPSSNQRIYVSRGAALYTTANGGNTWTTTATGWGGSTITYIAVHPQDPQRVLVVTSSSVYHSTNAGASWTNIGAGLPSGAKYCAAWENTGKNGIYIGGFGYVSYTNDDLAGQWIGFFDGLPNARVYELEINYVSNTIFAGTYGRGLWESTLYKALAPVAAFSADKQLGCREMTVTFTDHSANAPTAWEWTFENGTPATSTLQNPTVTFTGNGTFSVQLKASNNVGENTVVETGYITLVSASVPAVADVERCDSGEVTLDAVGHPADEIRWYATPSGGAPLFAGESFTTTVAQTTTFYAAAGASYVQTQYVGPASNSIGAGGDHAGNYFLILDALKPFRLKSAIVYANGAGNRTFQLRAANTTVLLEKTVYVDEGENRITLDMDIPQAANLQIGCISPANLFRNNAGVSYPYTLNGLVQIKSSTAGPDYYYYLYDLEVESDEICESDRVPVTATVNTAPASPVLAASGATTLCPGASVTLSVDSICPGCTVHWSTGETGPSVQVATAGAYTAVLRNNCGDSPASGAIDVMTETLPAAATLSASGATLLCPGASVALTAANVCSGCTVTWSTGETGPGITVSAAGSYTATLSNVCGDGPAADPILITSGALPDATNITASGPTTFCDGASVMLTAGNICSACTVTWSTGETGPAITVSSAGHYTAIAGNTCGDSPASNIIAVAVETVPALPALSVSGPTALCPGESVVLTVDNVCAGCNVSWSDGQTGPEITAFNDGLYTATVANACGDSPASNAIEVTTIAIPGAATVAASGATALCPGTSVALTADNVCAGCTVTWSTGETGSGITVSTAGIYTATVGNTCGDGPVSNAIETTTETLPEATTITASGATMLCTGESVELLAGNVCPDCTVLWSTGETGSSITVSDGGVYSATVGNACGNSPASNVITVAVGTAPAIPAITASGATALCPGESVTLSVDNNCFDCTVLWSTGETDASITVANDGVYTATVSNACGESPASNAITIVTLALPGTPTISASGATALCAGESVVLTAGNVCPGCTVHWSTGETGTNITVSGDGVYTATAKNNCGDSPASDAITVTSHPPFVPVVALSNVCHLSAPAGSNYQWYLDGVEIPGATGPMWTALVAGAYAVSMTDAEGCPGISQPVLAEACGSGTLQVAGFVSVQVYPNPAQDRIFLDIQVAQATDVQLDLFAADGRYMGPLFQGTVLPGRQVTDIVLPGVPAGVYRYRLATERGSVHGGLVVGRR